MAKLLLVVATISGIDGHGYISCPKPRQYRSEGINDPSTGTPIGWTNWMGITVPGNGEWAPGEQNSANLNSAIGGGLSNMEEEMENGHGICGDIAARKGYSIGTPGKPAPFGATEPRGTFLAGGVMDVQVVLTAYHAGWLEFRLCDPSKWGGDISQECFNENVLKIDESTPYYPAILNYQGMQGIGHLQNTGDGGWYKCKPDPLSKNPTPYWPKGTCCNDGGDCSLPAQNDDRYVVEFAFEQDPNYDVRLKIPASIGQCVGCVLQWSYVTANSRETYPETFYNCADITILAEGTATRTGCDVNTPVCSNADVCGVCGGDGQSCLGCDGVANSGSVYDRCGVCGGTNACVGCDGVPNSGKVADACGICEGDGSTCGCAPNCAGEGAISEFFSQEDWNRLFPEINNNACKGASVFTYANFIEAAGHYPAFAREGDVTMRKRELAAFLAQASFDTSGRSPDWTNEPYYWGLCFPEQRGCHGNTCSQASESEDYPPVPGKSYHGRGAIYIRENYNYGVVSEEVFGDANILLNNPELLSENGVMAFRVALWTWMTGVFPKPSAHEVMLDSIKEECACNRANGFGLTINIINGGQECGVPTPDSVRTRINYYKRYADNFKVSYGFEAGKDNLCCSKMLAYSFGPCDGDGTETCAFDNCLATPTPTPTPAPPSPTPTAATTRCGAGWTDADTKCGAACVSDEDCPSGEQCFAACSTTPCQSADQCAGGGTSTPTLFPTTAPPSTGTPSQAPVTPTEAPSRVPTVSPAPTAMPTVGTPTAPTTVTPRVRKILDRLVVPPDFETTVRTYPQKFRFLQDRVGTGMGGLGEAVLETYINDIEAAADAYPAAATFLNEDDQDANAKELCAYMTIINWETDFTTFEEGLCSGNAAETNQACRYTDANYPYVEGQTYHGRGPKQLSWNYNYAAFSQDYYGDANVLLEDPSLVLSDGKTMWASSMFFWMFDGEGNNNNYGGWCMPQAAWRCQEQCMNDPFATGLTCDSASGLSSCQAFKPTHYIEPGKSSPHDAIHQSDSMPLVINVVNGGYDCCPTTTYGPQGTSRGHTKDRMSAYLMCVDLFNLLPTEDRVVMVNAPDQCPVLAEESSSTCPDCACLKCAPTGSVWTWPYRCERAECSANTAMVKGSAVARVANGVGNHRVLAYLKNWLTCPTDEQLAHYTHIMISFAVTYTWNAGGNICDPMCQLKPTPGCSGSDLRSLVLRLQSLGIKALISVGGAGQGGTWPGASDCWDECFDSTDNFVQQVGDLVEDFGFDGVDIDYEYYTTSDSQRAFIRAMFEDVRTAIGPNLELTHAPRDINMVPTDAYYQILKDVSDTVDFVCVQYYNGWHNPVTQFDTLLNQYALLINDVFGGDATKVLWGFCNGDCPNFNVDKDQALQITQAIEEKFPYNGGVFVWSLTEDYGGSWSKPIYDFYQGLQGPTEAPTMGPPTSPTVAATATPTATPTAAPTGISCGDFGYCVSGGCVCSQGYTGTNCDIPPPEDKCKWVECGEGTCSDGKCYCPPEYEGDNCETPTWDACDNIDCGAHGYCEAGICICEFGYTPQYSTVLKCEEPPPDICQNMDCGDYGTCQAGTCVCTDNYYGTYCENEPSNSGCAGIQEWNANQVYLETETVVFDGKEYKAKWWTKNNSPDLGGPWLLQGSCGDDTSGGGVCDGAPAWDVEAEYQGASVVNFLDIKWGAKWWTKGEEPGTAGVWEGLASCDGPAVLQSPSWTLPTSVTLSNDLVPQFGFPNPSESLMNFGLKLQQGLQGLQEEQPVGFGYPKPDEGLDAVATVQRIMDQLLSAEDSTTVVESAIFEGTSIIVSLTTTYSGENSKAWANTKRAKLIEEAGIGSIFTSLWQQAGVPAASATIKNNDLYHAVDASDSCQFCGATTTCVDNMCVADCGAEDVCCGNTSPTVCTDPAISTCVGKFDPFCTSSGFDMQCKEEAMTACGLMCN